MSLDSFDLGDLAREMLFIDVLSPEFRVVRFWRPSGTLPQERRMSRTVLIFPHVYWVEFLWIHGYVAKLETLNAYKKCAWLVKVANL